MKHFAHHKHTGKVLAHHHTSYPALFVVLLLVGVFIGCIQSVAHADFMGLTAKISAELPTTPAAINTPVDGQEFTDPDIVVQGTCQELTPSSIIVIYIDGTQNAGSTTCQNGGTFTIAITLPAGTHSLVARTSNTTEDFGPDSNPVSVTYIAPIPDPEDPVTGGGTTSGGSSSGSKNNNGSNGSGTSGSCKNPDPLRIGSTQPYLSYGRFLAAEWEFKITGGCLPYKTVINWGDSTTDKFDIKDHDIYTMKHGYAELKPSYAVNMTVKSSDNQTARFATVAVTSWIPPNAGGSLVPADTPFINSLQGTLIKAYIAYIAVLMLAGLAWYDARIRRLHIAGRHFFPHPPTTPGGTVR